VIPARASLRQAQGPNSMSAFGVTQRIVRLAVGLEDTEDLWADLARALDNSVN
jgi:cystathionine beta-lyase/cystathionine gamma-synthase